MAVRITSIHIEPTGPVVEGLDRDTVQVVARAEGEGVRLTSQLTADEVADPELLEAYQALFDLVVRRIREQTARAWATAP